MSEPTANDDKTGATRRNLMVLATGIVTVFFLGLPIDGKLIGLVDLKGVNPIKVWIVALIGLWYFAVRYFLDPASRSSLEAWWKQSGIHVDNAVAKMLDRDKPPDHSNLPAGWILADPPPANDSQCWLVLVQTANENTWKYDATKREATATALWRGYVEQSDGTRKASFLTPAFAVTRKVNGVMVAKSGWMAARETFKPVWPFWEYVFPLIWGGIANYCCGLAIWLHLLRSPTVTAWREWIWSTALFDSLRSADPFVLQLLPT